MRDPVVLSLVPFLAILTFFAPAAPAQRRDATQHIAYVNVTQVGRSVNDNSRLREIRKSFRDFTEKLLELRVNELKTFRADLNAVPACGPESNATRPSLFYVIQASLSHVSANSANSASSEPAPSDGGQPDLVLDYQLLKYSQCKQTSLIQVTAPFTPKTALSSLTSMSNTIGLLLEQELANSKMVVRVDRLKGNSARAQQFADDITFELVSSLKDSVNFLPVDTPTVENKTPEYVLAGEVTVSDDNTLSTQFFIRATADANKLYSSQVLTLKEPNETNVRRFNEESSEAAIGFLNEVKYTRDAGFGEILTSEQLQELLARAKILMCFESGCPLPNYEEALPLLLVLSHRLNQNSDVFRMLARAFHATGKFVDSAQAYDRARALSKDAKLNLPLLSSAASAWYSARNFEIAARRYEEGLKLTPTYDAFFSIQLSRVYRFLGNPEKAVDTLVGLLRNKPQVEGKPYVISELRDVLRDIDKGTIVGVPREKVEGARAVASG